VDLRGFRAPTLWPSIPVQRASQTVTLHAAVQGQEPARERRNHNTIVSSPATHVEQLERVLLRRGLGALEADRTSCADCGRTPLAGEQVHLYSGRRQRIVCELCRPQRREPPLESEIVRHCEHGHTVRLMARAA
jgi:hypothetical protein